MFRCTTVALDTEERSGEEHLKGQGSNTKDSAQMQQVSSADPSLEAKLRSGPHCRSSCSSDNPLLQRTSQEHNVDTPDTALDISSSHMSHTNQTTQLSHIYNSPAAHRYVSPNIPTAATNSAYDNSALSPKNSLNIQSAVSNPHMALSDNRIRPVCFSLPKRSCVLRHQSAAVFLQASTKKEGATPPSDKVDHIELDSPEDLKDQPGLNEAVKSTEANSDSPKKSTCLERPKEPFCQVLSRDGVTVLLWPSEMVSYTSTAPSVSFSVNPLLHDFRAQSRAEESRTELGRRKPSVIKQAERQKRQGCAEEGGGASSKHERHQGGQPGWPVEVMAHCNSGNCDESALNCSLVSEQECHLVLLKKKGRRRKKKGRARRGMRRRDRKRRKEDKRLRARQITVNPKEEGRGNNNGAVYRPENRTKIRGDQTGSDDGKRAGLLSNLPVSWPNRCNQLCSQVNSQASRHPSQQSTSEWGQGFRKLPGGGAACSAVISLVPGSDIETARCPAITPAQAQGCTGMSEAQTESLDGQNEQRGNLRKAAIKETKESHVMVSWSSLACVVAAEKQGLAMERRCDEAISLDPVCCQSQTVPTGDPTSHCCIQLPQTQGKMKSTGVDVSLHSAAITEESRKRRDNSPQAERPPRKKHKKAETHMGKCLQKSYMSSDLSIQQDIQGLNNSEAQLVTAIVRTKTKTGNHFVSNHSLCSNIEDTLYTSKMYSCLHSQGKDRHCNPEKQDQTVVNSSTDCRTSEHQNTAQNSGATSDNGLTKKDEYNEHNKDHCCADVGQLQSPCKPAAHTGDSSDECIHANDPPNMFTEPTAHQMPAFPGCSCKTTERCHQNQIPKKAKSQVEDKRQSSESGTVMDSKHCRAIDQCRASPGGIDGGQCDYCRSNRVTNCNYPEKNTNGGVVVLISTHPEQTRRAARGMGEEERRRARGIREEGRKSRRGEAEWVCPLLPPPLSIHHTILRQHLSLLPAPLHHIPVPPYPRLLPSFAPHLSPVPPLLPQTFYPSTPVPFLDGPYPLPAAFHSQGGRSLYGPSPPTMLPIELIFS